LFHHDEAQNKEVSREFFKRKQGDKCSLHRNGSKWSSGTNEQGLYEEYLEKPFEVEASA